MNAREPNLQELYSQLRSLCILRELGSSAPIGSLIRMLRSFLRGDPPAEQIRRSSAYGYTLLPYQGALSLAVKHLLSSQETLFSRAALTGAAVPEYQSRMLHHELEVLRRAGRVSPDQMETGAHAGSAAAYWQARDEDLCAWYDEFLSSIPASGFGMFRSSPVFRLGRHGRVVPVPSYDRIQLTALTGYEWQRKLVVQDIEALLAGAPAVDMLLYGDSGTGKSSTIKAAANAYASRGLRLIEVRPSQLHHIPNLLEMLADNPLRFLLFIDDLSFTHEDKNFRALKGTLEGSVVSRARNVVICATSNRRHLIRESFADRGSDDVHANETLQQTVSLSDRFGLTIPFMNPRKDAFLEIVRKAARRAGITLPEDELMRGAERFAIEKGGRSGRAAVQYVDLVKAGLLR